jgi:DNA-directed RNA polymerase subunit beta
MVYEYMYTSFYIVRCKIEMCMKSQGPERITREIPHLDAHSLRHLEKYGLVMPRSQIEIGDIFVGKLMSQTIEELFCATKGRLLQTIFGVQVSITK